MADARALLRAKRQEARISHPHASYTASGQLRCTACGVPVKSAVMWEGHIGSKAHRVVVAALRQRQQEEERELARRQLAEVQQEEIREEEDVEEEERRQLGKRRARGAESRIEVNVEDEIRNTKKRMRSQELQPPTKMKAKTAGGGFPADFFSDLSRAPVLPADDGDDEDEDDDKEGGDEEGAPHTQQTTQASTSVPKSQIDLEWQQFQAAMQSHATEEAEELKEEERREAFERATVIAEAEIVNINAAEFPHGVSGADTRTAAGPPEAERKEESEEERRRRKEQEERELIMDRLIEEERAQEEADERVGLLKAKVEALKKMREARRASKNFASVR